MSGVPDQVTVQVGEETTLALPSLAGAGYRWEVTVDDAEVARAAVAFDAADPKASGQPAFSPFETLTIRGRRAGRTQVRCRQRRSWEQESAATAEQVLMVDVVAA